MGAGGGLLFLGQRFDQDPDIGILARLGMQGNGVGRRLGQSLCRCDFNLFGVGHVGGRMGPRKIDHGAFRLRTH